MARSASLPLILALAAALGACTKTDTTMGLLPPEPLAGVAIAPLDAPTRLVAAMPRPRTAEAVQAVQAVQFLPIVGVPTDKVELLAEALSASAAARGISVEGAGEAVAPVRLKGYLSAVGEGASTRVIYVWDVIDRTNTRVDRIQGEEVAAGGAADPWAAVGQETFDAIAAKTLDEAARLAPLG